MPDTAPTSGGRIRHPTRPQGGEYPGSASCIPFVPPGVGRGRSTEVPRAPSCPHILCGNSSRLGDQVTGLESTFEGPARLRSRLSSDSRNFFTGALTWPGRVIVSGFFPPRTQLQGVAGRLSPNSLQPARTPASCAQTLPPATATPRSHDAAVAMTHEMIERPPEPQRRRPGPAPGCIYDMGDVAISRPRRGGFPPHLNEMRPPWQAASVGAVRRCMRGGRWGLRGGGALCWRRVHAEGSCAACTSSWRATWRHCEPHV